MEEASKYQWPADKIGAKEMEILYNIKQQTGTAINMLIKKAVLKLQGGSND